MAHRLILDYRAAAHGLTVEKVVQDIGLDAPPNHIEPPVGCVWMKCADKQGKPGWFAVPAAEARRLQTQVDTDAAEEGQQAQDTEQAHSQVSQAALQVSHAMRKCRKGISCTAKHSG